MNDFKSLREIEKKKHFGFFLPFYRNKNWIVVEDHINNTYASDWDVKLEVFAGRYVLVDEKVIIGNWNNCLVELIQDLKTKNWGWFYKRKDWVLYSIWNDINDIEPTSLYLIKNVELIKHIFSLNGFQKAAICQKGWGLTWNVVFEWDDLIEKGIAEKII